MSPQNQMEALNRGRLYLHLKTLAVYEYIDTLQCKNCWCFGHLAHECSRPTACRNCGQQHQTESCINKKARCANCIRFNARKSTTAQTRRNTDHRVIDRCCQDYRNRLEGLKTFKSIKYVHKHNHWQLYPVYCITSVAAGRKSTKSTTFCRQPHTI